MSCVACWIPAISKWGPAVLVTRFKSIFCVIPSIDMYCIQWDEILQLHLLRMLQHPIQQITTHSAVKCNILNVQHVGQLLNDIALGPINHIYFPSAILSCRFLMWASFPWASLHDRPGCVGRQAILCGPLSPSLSTCVTFKGKKKKQILPSYNPDEDN